MRQKWVLLAGWRGRLAVFPTKALLQSLGAFHTIDAYTGLRKSDKCSAGTPALTKMVWWDGDGTGEASPFACLDPIGWADGDFSGANDINQGCPRLRANREDWGDNVCEEKKKQGFVNSLTILE